MLDRLITELKTMMMMILIKIAYRYSNDIPFSFGLSISLHKSSRQLNTLLHSSISSNSASKVVKLLKAIALFSFSPILSYKSATALNDVAASFVFFKDCWQVASLLRVSI